MVAGVQAQTPAVKKAVRSGSTQADQDRKLEAAIRARFARSKIDANHFRVRVEGGVATLEGRTDVIQHKGTATRLARAVGAKRVENRIEIGKEARERASANLAKGRRRAQLKRSQPRSEQR
jgi:osmotically-inducible protein OsmY